MTAHVVSKPVPPTEVKAEKAIVVGVASTTSTHVDGMALEMLKLCEESLLVGTCKSESSGRKNVDSSHLCVGVACEFIPVCTGFAVVVP